MRKVDLADMRGASSEVARDINRRIVLNLVRKRQPLSRADLARLSGLQRSTVSLITEQLVKERWVTEGPGEHLPRGRRPTFLRLNSQRVVVGIDIRPVQTTVLLADVNGHFLSRETMETPRNPHIAIAELTMQVKRLIGSRPETMFEGIGITLPGRLDQESRKLVFAPNLKWPVVDLKTPFERATGLDVELENAANACVLSEVWFGEREGIQNLVVVTVSEGIGTGIFMNGQLVRGLHGAAGEFGHVSLDPSGPACTCGGRGCWEVFASNRAALRYYKEATGNSANPSFQDLLDLAERGDHLAGKALDTMAHYLGRGLRMVVAGVAPEAIVIVGELTRSWQRFGPVVKSEVAAQMLAGPSPEVAPALDGGLARLRGTVALVLQKHFGSNRVLPG
ncbi:MAG: ROK family protein [Bryobacteraceae bacterium]